MVSATNAVPEGISSVEIRRLKGEIAHLELLRGLSASLYSPLMVVSCSISVIRRFEACPPPVTTSARQW